ncbi:hypothetical protein CC86DRAFT_6477 [Ophiobolus disseminans]|uniref:Uncharacterized protein n=1 Tax=Ophiobolus disseminans TaxID=1469910 RepID=A0A6A7AKS4_9PLEO|nr:hypothetical protein CC86DRAFT_6477 [Ophiobolus disseminans]
MATYNTPLMLSVLKGCPEEIPCSDDKYADDSSKSLLDFSRENTVLGNMARSRVTFMLWLYATVTIRDGMKGSVHTEEVQWFYNKALKLMQETLKKEAEAGQYSDHLLNALSCITAAASFAGMFNTAVLHRDATIRVLRIRGDGDVLKGLQSAPAWTSKALQWCEMMVATQLAETPQMPYYHATTSKPLPDNVVYEAEQLTAATLSNLPCVSEPIQYIIRLLHQIGVAYAKRTAGTKVDSYIIEPLYDALYALLQMQEAHKKTGILSDAEHLLVETFQLYFWTGVRLLPPATRLCDLLVSRVMKALLPLLLNTLPEEAENFCQTARGYAVDTSIDEERVLKTLNHPSTTNNLIAWSLALGTVATMPLNRPEYMWFKGHFQSYLQAMGLDQDEEGYYALLKMFPTTDGLGWIGLKKLFGTLQT